MKKNTVAAVVLAVLAIFALCALALYVTWQYREDLSPAHSDRMESEADAVIQALGGTAAETPDAGRGQSGSGDSPADAGEPEKGIAGTEQPASAKTGTGNRKGTSGSAEPFAIWVGDSRTIGMQNAVDNNDLYIAAAGEGYDWFVETGLEELKKAIREYDKLPVVFNFGVNDYDNLDNYMNLYVSLTEEYPDTHFYFLSVNPIDPEVCHNITNEEIADFNSHLSSLFPDTYLDSYTLLRANDITPIDGVHYAKEDYRFIYEYAAAQITAKNK